VLVPDLPATDEHSDRNRERGDDRNPGPWPSAPERDHEQQSDQQDQVVRRRTDEGRDSQREPQERAPAGEGRTPTGDSVSDADEHKQRQRAERLGEDDTRRRELGDVEGVDQSGRYPGQLAPERPRDHERKPRGSDAEQNL
jgi:hypothetical protein